MVVVDGGKKAKNKKLKSNLRNLPELKEINKELNKELTGTYWNLLELKEVHVAERYMWPSGLPLSLQRPFGRAVCR